MNRSLAVSALVSWLLAESLGLVMLRTWVASGAARQRKSRPDGMSLPVLAGHASLAFSGLLSWIGFLLSASPVAGFIAVALLAPAIGLGASTVAVWTPYPVRRGAPEPELAPGSPSQVLGAADRSHGAVPDDVLARALEDDAAAGKLVDELLARNLAFDPADPRRPGLDPRALVPLVHGILAIATFMLATLAAISAV